jgi:iron complex transport system substrate-binding protein
LPPAEGSGLAGQAGGVLPRRIVSLSPNLTEILYDIGAGERLVGVTDFCKFPPEARKKEKVGGWINPNYEKIISLKPDLVVALRFYGKNEETFRRLGVPIEVLDCDTLAGILGAYDILGKRLGLQAGAEKAKERLEKRMEKIRRKARAREPVSVLFVIGRTPGTLSQIYGVGPRNFLDEIIRAAGGRNVLRDSSAPYPIVSKEALLRRDPEVIVDALPASGAKPGEFAKEAAVWGKMASLKAVINGNVYCFSDEDFMIPGPTLARLADYLSEIFEKASRFPKNR